MNNQSTGFIIIIIILNNRYETKSLFVPWILHWHWVIMWMSSLPNETVILLVGNSRMTSSVSRLFARRIKNMLIVFCSCSFKNKITNECSNCQYLSADCRNQVGPGHRGFDTAKRFMKPHHSECVICSYFVLSNTGAVQRKLKKRKLK